MLRFTTLNNKVVIDPSVLLVKEFTDILDYCKKQKGGEDLANQFLFYIFYCCDLTDANMLRDVDYRQKEDQANKRAFNSNTKKVFTPKEEELVSAAIDAYNYFNENALERATLTYAKKIDEIRTLLENTKPELHAIYRTCVCTNCMQEEIDVIEKYVANDAIIGNFAKQLNEMATYQLRAVETSKKIENVGRVRGDKGSSLIERGAFTRLVDNPNDDDK